MCNYQLWLNTALTAGLRGEHSQKPLKGTIRTALQLKVQIITEAPYHHRQFPLARISTIIQTRSNHADSEANEV